MQFIFFNKLLRSRGRYIWFNIWCVFIKLILLFCRSINNKTLPIIPDPIMELMKLNEAEDIELVPLFLVSLCEDNKQSLSLSIWKDKNPHQEHVQCISDIYNYSWVSNVQTHLLNCASFLSFVVFHLKQSLWDVLDG